MIMDLYNKASERGINKFEYVHDILKRQLMENGFDIMLFDWAKSPEEIVRSVDDMLDQIKSDFEFERNYERMKTGEENEYRKIKDGQ